MFAKIKGLKWLLIVKHKCKLEKYFFMSMFCLLLPLGSGIGNDKFNFFRPGNDILNMFVDLGMINLIHL